jgi:hypothetical protein
VANQGNQSNVLVAVVPVMSPQCSVDPLSEELEESGSPKAPDYESSDDAVMDRHAFDHPSVHKPCVI